MSTPASTPAPTPSGTTGDQARPIREELEQDAGRLKADIGARARQEAERGKSAAGQVAGSASSALHSAAQDLDDNPDAPDWMASALQQAARRIEQLASHIDDRGIDDLTGEVARFAREHPGTFLAASAAAGFAAARVMRAGADRKHDHSGESAQAGAGARGTDWPADENVQPQADGEGFAPAYGVSASAGGAGQ